MLVKWNNICKEWWHTASTQYICIFFPSFPQNMFYCHVNFSRICENFPKGALVSLGVPRCSVLFSRHSHAHTHTFFVLRHEEHMCMRQTCSNGRVCFNTRGWKGRAVRLYDQVWDHCLQTHWSPRLSTGLGQVTINLWSFSERNNILLYFKERQSLLK